MGDAKQPTSTYRLTLRNRIVDAAMAAFAAHGIKAVKMDDIATGLGISKRTLYEIFENKEALLLEGVMRSRKSRKEELRIKSEEFENVMDIILYMYRKHVEEMGNVCPQFYVDIEKYPSVVALSRQEDEHSHESFRNFVLRGIGEGYFRADVDIDLITQLFGAISEFIMKHQLYRQYTVDHLFRNLVLVSLRGLCSAEGVKVLDDFFSRKSD